jgi:hypothetical protein
MKHGEGPLYRFIFNVQKHRGFGTETEQLLNAFVDVLDTCRLRVLLGSGSSMDDLIANRAANIGFVDDLECGKPVFVPFPSMAIMRRAAGMTCEKDLFAEFDRSMPTVLRLLSGARASIGVLGSDEHDLNVIDGRIRRATGPVSPLREEIDAKYRDYVREYGTKTPEQRIRRAVRTR